MYKHKCVCTAHTPIGRCVTRVLRKINNTADQKHRTTGKATPRNLRMDLWKTKINRGGIAVRPNRERSKSQTQTNGILIWAGRREWFGRESRWNDEVNYYYFNAVPVSESV